MLRCCVLPVKRVCVALPVKRVCVACEESVCVALLCVSCEECVCVCVWLSGNKQRPCKRCVIAGGSTEELLYNLGAVG